MNGPSEDLLWELLDSPAPAWALASAHTQAPWHPRSACFFPRTFRWDPAGLGLLHAAVAWAPEWDA
jgi:hypothetical protein